MKEDSRQLFNRFAYIAIVLIFVTGESAANSEGDEQSVVNYSYAVFFGTGSYEVNDQTAYVIRAPLAYRIREPSSESPGVKLLLPVLAGFYDYDLDSTLKASTPGDAATLSFVPGLEYEYIVNERWRLKPFGQFGLGRDLENNENSLIYVAGVNSHYSLPGQGKWQFALGNTMAYTGFSPEDGSTQSLGILGAGIDTLFPWKFNLFGKETGIANSLIYYFYLDNPSFEQGDDRSKSVTNEIEWSLALNFEKPRKLMGIEFDRLGLGFRYGDNIWGIRLVTKFPF